MRRALCLIGLVLSAAVASRAAVVPIADVKQITASGDVVNLGRQVTVAGVVTVGSGTYSATDLDVYIQDATAGINIYKRNAGYFSLKLGDSIMVTGLVDQGGAPPTRGNTKIGVASLQDIVILGRGSVPGPLTVNAAELGADAQPPLEAYEGLLVRVERVTLNPADWPAAGQDKSLTAQDPTGSFNLRIDHDTGISGTDVPRQPFIVVGVVVQDDPTTPWLSGYTVWPRSRQADFLVMGDGCGTAQVEPSVVETGRASFDLTVTLAGNHTDTITTFSVGLPLAEGWNWSGGVELSGPGLAGATYEATSTGVTVHSSGILDDVASYGAVTFKGVSPPAVLVSSEIDVKTAIGGGTLADIAFEPSIRSVRPKPPVVLNEVFPNDGAEATSDAFIELHNQGTSTAYLQDFVLCEARPVPYCDTEVRYTFAAGDTIPVDGYFVIGESASGFAARFGQQPTVQAAISPLGRVSGDGGICGDGQTYEAISLWRDATLTDLVDYVQYRDGVACSSDLCDIFGSGSVSLPLIPPRRYAIVSKVWSSCCPYEALSADPTPGAANRIAYLNPVSLGDSSYSGNILEVFFSEPMDTTTTVASAFLVNGEEALAVRPSLSGEKALVLTNDLPLDTNATLEIKGLASWAGKAMDDTTVDFRVTPNICTKPCDIQAYDANGYSPLNGKVVTMFGFITVPPGIFQPSYQSIYVQGLDGCGLNVFSYTRSSPVPHIGDFVRLSGTVTEYASATAGSTTEISMGGGEGLTIFSKGYPEPPALVLSTGAVGKEDYEGRLVQTEGVVVSTSDYSFYVDDGSGGIQIYQNYTAVDFTRIHKGMDVKVKGVILQYDYTIPFLDGYELVPRYDGDIEIVEGAFPRKAILGIDAHVFCPSCGEDGFRIRFGAPSLSEVTLRIFDGAGRLVSTLYSGASVGDREIIWTGRDDEGKVLPAGLYICHIKAVESVSGATSTESAPIVIGTQLK